MKKKIGILFALIVCTLMVHTGLMASTAVPVSGAVKTNGTIDLQKKALIIPNGKKTAIKQNKVTIVRGCRYQIKAKSTKAKLKSSNPSVLSVSKKIITAKKPGSATLKITYKNKNQSLKIKVVASHKHSFKTTRKATCKTKGVQTCSVCGTTEYIAKTSHNWRTATWESFEGRGKPYEVVSTYCGGCGTDMTDWTKDEIALHRTNFDHFPCFGANIYGVDGEVRYPKYMKVKKTEITCKQCGAWKDKFQEDLYECDGYGYKLPDGEDAWSVYKYENYCDQHRTFKHICADKHSAQTTAKKAPVKSAAAPQEVINNDADTVNTAEIKTE